MQDADDPMQQLRGGRHSDESAPSAGGAGRKPRHGELWKLAFSERVSMEFVFVDAPAVSPHGFLMGSPLNEPGRSSDEAQHRVILTRPYWIQTTPVTPVLRDPLRLRAPGPPALGGRVGIRGSGRQPGALSDG